MKYILWLLRIIVGVLFIFSGLVKANDPSGLAYKMSEFFEVLHMYAFMDYSFQLSLVMIAFEIIAGVSVLMGYAFRVFSFLLLLLNILFTFLTAFALFSGKVKECGCFGDCIPLSNEVTFWKDVVLLAMAIILFAYRKRVQPVFSKYVGTAIFIICVFLSAGIQWWALEHLPFHDCLPYKIGANLWTKMQVPPGAIPDQYESVLIYEKDGVQKEFTMQNYPWQDSTWKFVDRKDKLVRKGNADPEIKDFALNDADGNDHTKEILTAPGYTFLWFVRDPATARMDNMDSLKVLINKAVQVNIPFYVLCSTDKETTAKYQQQWNLMDIPFYILDGTVSKTAMRSNPGLMLLKDGGVIGKWSYRDYPRIASFENDKLELK